MRRAERVVDVNVEKRRKPSYEIGFLHIRGGELHVLLESRNFLREIAEITEDYDFALFKRFHPLDSRVAAYVVDIIHFYAAQLRKPFRVRRERDEILIVERVALMCDYRRFRARFDEVLKSGYRLIEPVVVDYFAFCVYGRIYVRAEKYALAAYVRSYKIFNAYFFHFPMPR